MKKLLKRLYRIDFFLNQEFKEKEKHVDFQRALTILYHFRLFNEAFNEVH